VGEIIEPARRGRGRGRTEDGPKAGGPESGSQLRCNVSLYLSCEGEWVIGGEASSAGHDQKARGFVCIP
jgi:hypothetical protein